MPLVTTIRLSQPTLSVLTVTRTCRLLAKLSVAVLKVALRCVIDHLSAHCGDAGASAGPTAPPPLRLRLRSQTNSSRILRGTSRDQRISFARCQCNDIIVARLVLLRQRVAVRAWYVADDVFGVGGRPACQLPRQNRSTRQPQVVKQPTAILVFPGQYHPSAPSARGLRRCSVGCSTGSMTYVSL